MAQQNKTDRPMTIQEAYEARPRLWWAYTLILLIVFSLLGWSGSAVVFKGFATKGVEVAKGVWNGLTHPDTALLFNLTPEGVPYQLLQTVAIAVLGTLIGGILAIPFSFLASDKIVPGWVAFLFRAFILMIRTIPSLVWALVWIRVTGPNAFCGVVTQSICSIGMISKMYITAIADVDTRILESLDAAGCTAFQKIRYGLLHNLAVDHFADVPVPAAVARLHVENRHLQPLGGNGAQGGVGIAQHQQRIGLFLLDDLVAGGDDIAHGLA